MAKINNDQPKIRIQNERQENPNTTNLKRSKSASRRLLNTISQSMGDPHRAVLKVADQIKKQIGLYIERPENSIKAHFPKSITQFFNQNPKNTAISEDLFARLNQTSNKPTNTPSLATQNKSLPIEAQPFETPKHRLDWEAKHDSFTERSLPEHLTHSDQSIRFKIQKSALSSIMSSLDAQNEPIIKASAEQTLNERTDALASFKREQTLSLINKIYKDDD